MDFEAEVQRIYESILRPGMGAVDVGAHVGRHGLEMLRCVAPSGRVVMFEPIPALFQALASEMRQSADWQQLAEVHPFALSDAVGETEFCIAVDAPGFSGIRERRYDVPTRVEKIRVEMRRLDDVVRHWVRVDYIKIDTEGAEWNVIKGASDTIDLHRPIVTFEFGANSFSAFNVDPVDVFDFFDARSYDILDILGRRLERAAFNASAFRQEVWDYIAVPKEKKLLLPAFAESES